MILNYKDGKIAVNFKDNKGYVAARHMLAALGFESPSAPKSTLSDMAHRNNRTYDTDIFPMELSGQNGRFWGVDACMDFLDCKYGEHVGSRMRAREQRQELKRFLIEQVFSATGEAEMSKEPESEAPKEQAPDIVAHLQKVLDAYGARPAPIAENPETLRAELEEARRLLEEKTRMLTDFEACQAENSKLIEQVAELTNERDALREQVQQMANDGGTYGAKAKQLAVAMANICNRAGQAFGHEEQIITTADVKRMLEWDKLHEQTKGTR